MNRAEVLNSVKENVENSKQVRHMLATEAIMRALARRLGEDEAEWGLTGLVHDIDIELIDGDMYLHGKLGADLVRDLEGSEAMAHAVLCHNRRHNISVETGLDAALICSDPLSKIIISAAGGNPRQKLDSVSAGMVEDLVRDAQAVSDQDRDRIALCADLGLTRSELIELGLTAMNKIAADIGL